ARDAELVAADDVHAGEELAHMGMQDRGEEDEGVLGAGMRLRQPDEARQRARRLHDRGARAAAEGVAPLELDGEVQALVQHPRERMRRVEADRRKHRKQFAEEVVADPLLLRPGPFLAPRAHDAAAGERIDRGRQATALEALGKFAAGLRGFPREAVRAVGTNARPIASTASQFRREARSVLGFPIEVISGREEARLIYLGVAHSLPVSAERRLVVDIGGGSTEFIIGTGLEPQLTESLYMGCLSYSLKYFRDGKIDKSAMKAAELAARQ